MSDSDQGAKLNIRPCYCNGSKRAAYIEGACPKRCAIKVGKDWYPSSILNAPKLPIIPLPKSRSGSQHEAINKSKMKDEEDSTPQKRRATYPQVSSGYPSPPLTGKDLVWEPFENAPVVHYFDRGGPNGASPNPDHRIMIHIVKDKRDMNRSLPVDGHEPRKRAATFPP